MLHAAPHLRLLAVAFLLLLRQRIFHSPHRLAAAYLAAFASPIPFRRTILYPHSFMAVNFTAVKFRFKSATFFSHERKNIKKSRRKHPVNASDSEAENSTLRCRCLKHPSADSNTAQGESPRIHSRDRAKAVSVSVNTAEKTIHLFFIR